MTELVHKRKRLTDEERKRRNAKNTKLQNERMKKELEEIKAKRPKKVPFTKEELRERIKEQQDEQKRIEKDLAKKKYQPPNIMEIMKKINKIYSRGELEELAGKTGIFEGHFKSWIFTDRRPRGKDLTELQEYFGKLNK